MIEYVITMTARCDNCGKELSSATLSKPADIERRRWAWITEWKKAGVMMRDRAFKKPLVFCQPCADGRGVACA